MGAKLAISSLFLAHIPVQMPSGDDVIPLTIDADLRYVPAASITGKTDEDLVKMICAGVRDVRDAAGNSVLEREPGVSPQQTRDDLLAGDHGGPLATRIVVFYLSDMPTAVAKNSSPSPSN